MPRPAQGQGSRMRIVHLTASTFFGGPERQMLGLAAALPPHYSTACLCFPEGGRSEAFLCQVRHAGFHGDALTNDTPHFRAAVAEIARRVGELRADVLIA